MKNIGTEKIFDKDGLDASILLTRQKLNFCLSNSCFDDNYFISIAKNFHKETMLLFNVCIFSVKTKYKMY